MDKNLIAVIKNFPYGNKIDSINPYGNGHINVTYYVKTDLDEFILQKINTEAFKDVDSLMRNIEIVTSFMEQQHKMSLEIIKTNDGKLYYQNEEGCYRLYKFIKNSKTYETVGNDYRLANKLGLAFGEFHRDLNSLDATLLTETIVNFHNTEQRYTNFCQSLTVAEPFKKEKAKEEIKYINEQKESYSLLVDKLNKGEIHQRITHNDPKINNILFNKDNDDILAIIDLDTVMPGSVLYDVGDAFRSLFTGNNEDNTDVSLLKVNFDIFKEYMMGYLSVMKDYLNEEEIHLLPYSIYLLSIECGMRFLEDYLRGNVYFHVKYEEHNLIRSRTQIALAKNVLANLDKLNQIIKEILEELKHA